MSRRRPGNGGNGDRGTRPPATPAEALSEAARHARASAAEALLALRSLLHALALATDRDAEAEGGTLRELAALLEGAARSLGAEGGREGELLTALFEAIEVEIRRWEERALDDTDARAVLRAWIGLRELLFELGARPRRARDRGREEPRRPGRRVRRVPVED